MERDGAIFIHRQRLYQEGSGNRTILFPRAGRDDRDGYSQHKGLIDVTHAYSFGKRHEVCRPRAKEIRVIGHDVWIGDQSIILLGVTVGTGAVIAAGSIVTKDVEPYAIVGGNYAKLIEKRPWRVPDQDVRDRLLKSRWWELPLDVLRSSPFWSPTEFLEWLEKNGEGLRRDRFISVPEQI